MEYYVYVWRDANGVPFYVGKGHGQRAHNTSKRSKEFKEIQSSGGCSVEIVRTFTDEQDAYSYEIELIARYGRRVRGGTLVNKTDGGDGFKGVHASPEWREKISSLLRGRKKTPEHVEKIAAKKRGSHHSDETKRQMSLTRKGRKFSEAVRAERRERLKGYIPVVAIKISADMRRGKKRPQWAVDKCNHEIRLLPPRGSSGFKGVRFSKKRGTWCAGVNSKKKYIHLGTFKSPEDAARAYDAKAVDLWGVGNCYLNFPDDYAFKEAAE